MNHPDGSPAFPALGTDRTQFWDGMSLRDWFAGMALQGFLASQHEGWSGTQDTTVRFAFEYADAMLAQRKAQP